MNTSGKAISLAPFSAASAISAMAFLMEPSRSRKAGAACTTATLYLGCEMPIGYPPCLPARCIGRFPVDRSRRPLHSVCPSAGRDARLARNKNSTAAALAQRQSETRGTDVAFGRCERRRDADPFHHRCCARIPPSGALAGHRLRCLCRARLHLLARQRLPRRSEPYAAWAGRLLGGVIGRAAGPPHAVADRACA